MPCHPGIVSMSRLTLKYFTDAVNVIVELLPAVNGFLLHWVLPPVLSGLSSIIAPRPAPGISVCPQPEIGRPAPVTVRRAPLTLTPPARTSCTPGTTIDAP